MISTLPVKDLPNPGGLGILVFLCALREESSGRAEDSEGPGPGVLRCPLWAGSALQPVACRGRVSGCRERKAAGACSASSLRMPARLCFPVPPPAPPAPCTLRLPLPDASPSHSLRLGTPFSAACLRPSLLGHSVSFASGMSPPAAVPWAKAGRPACCVDRGWR